MDEAVEKWKYGFTGFKPFDRTTSSLKPGDPIKFAGNVCVTNRKSFFDYDLKADVDDDGPFGAEAQRAIDAVQNIRLDNISAHHHPSMTLLPPHAYSYLQQREAIRALDPYNWGKVFDLTWRDWYGEDPTHATVTGRWEARVKPQFQGIFSGEVWTHSRKIAMDYLSSRVDDVHRIKKHAKEQCYRELVDQLQDVILERIARDIKLNA